MRLNSFTCRIQGSGCCWDFMADTLLQYCVEGGDSAFGLADWGEGSSLHGGRLECIPTLEDHSSQPALEDLCQITGEESPSVSWTSDSLGTILFSSWLLNTGWNSSSSQWHFGVCGSLTNRPVFALRTWRRHLTAFLRISCVGVIPVQRVRLCLHYW